MNHRHDLVGWRAALLLTVAGALTACHPFQEADGDFPAIEVDAAADATDTSGDVPIEGDGVDGIEADGIEADGIELDGIELDGDTGGGSGDATGDLFVDADDCQMPSLELCGSGLDEDCDGEADESDCFESEGIFVASWGTSEAVGTADEPLDHLDVAIERATLAGGVPIYIAGGVYQTPVTKPLTVDGVRLLGGYDCPERGCSWTRDLADDSLRPRLQLGDDSGLVVAPGLTSATVIEGLHLVGSGLLDDSGVSATLTIRGGATPTVHGNTIQGSHLTNTVCDGTDACSSIAVDVPFSDVQVADTLVFENNRVLGGNAPGGWSAGVRFSATATNAEFSRNEIVGGVANDSNGVFVQLDPGSDARNVVFERNKILAGHATTASIAMEVVGSVLIEGNRINASAATGSCEGFDCGGLRLLGRASHVVNNQIFGTNGSTSFGIDIRIEEGSPAAELLVIHSNTIDAGPFAPDATTAEHQAAIQCRVDGPSNASGNVGVVIDNVMSVGRNAERRVGVELVAGIGIDCRPTTFVRNAFLDPAMTGAGDLPVAYRRFDAETMSHVSFSATQINELPGFQDNFDVGLGAFVSYPTDMHPSHDDSPLVDAGTSRAAVQGYTPGADLDGLSRPQGEAHDVGAWEHP